MVVVIFICVLLLSFTAVFFLTKPSEGERQVQERLSRIGLDLQSPVSSDEPATLLRHVTYSGIPVLDNLFRRIPFTRNLKQMILQANSEWTVGRVILATLTIFFAAFWLTSFVVSYIPIRLIVAVVLAVIPYVWIRIQRARRLQRFTDVIPEAIDLMTRALRAGHSVSSAIEMVAREIADPVGTEFRVTFEQQNFGLPFRESLEDLARRVPVADLRFLVTAILVQKETGGNLTEVLDKAAAVIRERQRLQGELRIYTAQGRLTSYILGLLPFIMFMLLSLINHQYTSILLEDPMGQHLVLAGLALMGAGFYAIRRIVDIKV